MLLLAIFVALNNLGLASDQSQPATFRAEAYAVPFYISISHGKKPIVDLTIAHFTIILDKQTYVPLRVEQDPEKPGHYVVSFEPPDGVRDGKIHNVEVKVKKRRLNASFNFSIPIQKRPTESREQAPRTGERGSCAGGAGRAVELAHRLA